MGFSFMKKIKKYTDVGKALFFPLLSILVFIIITKQIGIFDRIVNIYDSLSPVLYGVLIAFLYQPLIDKLTNKLSRKVSVTIVYFGVLIFLCAFLFFVLPLIYQQIMDFGKILPKWIQKIEEFLYHLPYVNIDSKFIESYIQNDGYATAMDVMKQSIDSITSFGIAYISAYFISLDLEFWLKTFKKISPNYNQFKTFYYTMSNVVYRYLVGTVFDMLFIIISNGIVLYFIGFPNAFLYAVLMSLFNLFPYIGPTIGFLIILFVGILSYPSPPWIAFLIIWLIQQLEANIIQPFIFHKTMDVRPILTFLSLFVFEAIFGIVGMILSPIFASIIQIGFRSYIHSKTTNKVGKWEDIWYDFDEVMAKFNEHQQN